MDARAITRRRGVRMAMQVAALSAAAGAVVAAATATEAQADVGGAALASSSGVDGVAGPTESMQVKGWSCWGGPISRGPLAPPPQGDADFEALLAEVPS